MHQILAVNGDHHAVSCRVVVDLEWGKENQAQKKAEDRVL